MQNILELKMKLEEQQKMDLAAARINLNEEEDKLKELYKRKNEYRTNDTRYKKAAKEQKFFLQYSNKTTLLSYSPLPYSSSIEA